MSAESDARRVARGWLGGLEPVLECLAADIRSDLHREPDTGDLLLVLLSSLNAIAAESGRNRAHDYASLKDTLEQIRAQRVAAERKTQRRLDALTRAKESAIAARDFERAEKLHSKQIKITIEDQRATSAFNKMLIDFSRQILGITDAFGDRRAAG